MVTKPNRCLSAVAEILALPKLDKKSVESLLYTLDCQLVAPEASPEATLEATLEASPEAAPATFTTAPATLKPATSSAKAVPVTLKPATSSAKPATFSGKKRVLESDQSLQPNKTEKSSGAYCKPVAKRGAVPNAANGKENRRVFCWGATGKPCKDGMKLGGYCNRDGHAEQANEARSQPSASAFFKPTPK
jgi:hypothetical protein